MISEKKRDYFEYEGMCFYLVKKGEYSKIFSNKFLVDEERIERISIGLNKHRECCTLESCGLMFLDSTLTDIKHIEACDEVEEGYIRAFKYLAGIDLRELI